MARARNIKPGFYKNEDLAECSVWARLIYPGLWQQADREGRLEDRPKKLKGELLPHDTKNVDPLLDELDAKHFILRYEVQGKKIIQVLKFRKHQNPHHKEPESALPPPPVDVLASRGLVASANGYEPGITDLLHGLTTQGLPKSCPAESGFLKPDSLPPESGLLTAHVHSSAGDPAAGVAAWNGYAAAFQGRYGVPPVRNARVNAQLKQLVQRIPAADAAAVAEFYLQHNQATYVRAQHSVGLLLRDCEGLHAQWRAGRRTTDSEARAVDATDARAQQVHRLAQEKAA